MHHYSTSTIERWQIVQLPPAPITGYVVAYVNLPLGAFARSFCVSLKR